MRMSLGRNLALAPVALFALSAHATPASAEPEPSSSRGDGVIFTIDNDADANHVLAFARHRDGSLSPAGSFATGGAGSGANLGTASALTFALDGRVLLAVNAGSNDVSSFLVDGTRLTLVSRVSAGGTSPGSIAAHGHAAYVLDLGTPNVVSGLWLDDDGSLSPIAGSTHALSAASVSPAQVAFAPSGDELVVTERTTNLVDVLPLSWRGTPRELLTFASTGETPFGFAFAHDALVVSDAFGGTPGATALSSYRFDGSGALVDVSDAVPDGQTAACWVAATRDGDWVVASNAHNGTLSSYAVARDGALTLGSTTSSGEGSTPLDAAFDATSRRVYVLDAGTNAIKAFALGADGSLTATTDGTTGLPASTTGLIAR